MPPALRCRASAFRRIRWKPSPRNISGASARWASSSARMREAGAAAGHVVRADISPSHRQRDQAEGADDNAPPGEQDEAVTRDVIEERLHHDDGGDEGHNETDCNDAEMVRRHLRAVLVEVIG